MGLYVTKINLTRKHRSFMQYNLLDFLFQGQCCLTNYKDDPTPMVTREIIFTYKNRSTSCMTSEEWLLVTV